ncbi:hypothetical protein LCGC14_0357460 [marine sediment metagenome]|uniref:Uncharacterized protein n=1 Tax=marine sediment metagenome TaxID=412755 RepID=A0A0F9TS65_9ZZZZ
MSRISIPRANEGDPLSAQAWRAMRGGAQRDTVPTHGISTDLGTTHHQRPKVIPPRLFELTEDMLHEDDSGDFPTGTSEYPNVRYANNAKPVNHDLGTNAYIIDPTNIFTTIYETGVKSGGMDASDEKYLEGDRVWCQWNQKSRRWEFQQVPSTTIVPELPYALVKWSGEREGGGDRVMPIGGVSGVFPVGMFTVSNATDAGVFEVNDTEGFYFWSATAEYRRLYDGAVGASWHENVDLVTGVGTWEPGIVRFYFGGPPSPAAAFPLANRITSSALSGFLAPSIGSPATLTANIAGAGTIPRDFDAGDGQIVEVLFRIIKIR